MTVTTKVLVQPLQLATAATTQYTTPLGTRAIIDKATVTNTDSANRTFTVHIVPASGSAGNGNMIIDSRAVVPDETYLCPELVGQVLNPGDTLVTLCSAATALTLRVSGREIT